MFTCTQQRDTQMITIFHFLELMYSRILFEILLQSCGPIIRKIDVFKRAVLMYVSYFYLNGLSHLRTIYLPEANTLVASLLLSILLIQLMFPCMSRSVFKLKLYYIVQLRRVILVLLIIFDG